MDIAILISKFLEDKAPLRDHENDCVNIIDNQIVSWTFTNIPVPTAEELSACQVLVEAEQAKDSILKQIADLEAQITPRRLREAVITADYTFIQSIESQIVLLRQQLL